MTPSLHRRTAATVVTPIEIRRLVNQIANALRRLYKGEEKTKLYKPADPKQIEAFERKHKFSFPVSYRAFLELHNGWEGYVDGFALIGVTGRHTDRALADIRLTVDSFLDSWSLTYGVPDDEKVRQYESTGNLMNSLEVSRQAFIPNKIHFATNFNGGLRFFDPARPQPRGEMEVVVWSTSAGTIARYSGFMDMLRNDLHRLTRGKGLRNMRKASVD